MFFFETHCISVTSANIAIIIAKNYALGYISVAESIGVSSFFNHFYVMCPESY